MSLADERKFQKILDEINDRLFLIKMPPLEKLIEYQQVAALLVRDIEFAHAMMLDFVKKHGVEDFAESIKNEELDEEQPFRFLAWVINDLKEKTNAMTTDHEERQMRFHLLRDILELC